MTATGESAAGCGWYRPSKRPSGPAKIISGMFKLLAASFYASVPLALTKCGTLFRIILK